MFGCPNMLTALTFPLANRLAMQRNCAINLFTLSPIIGGQLTSLSLSVPIPSLLY